MNKDTIETMIRTVCKIIADNQRHVNGMATRMLGPRKRRWGPQVGCEYPLKPRLVWMLTAKTEKKYYSGNYIG